MFGLCLQIYKLQIIFKMILAFLAILRQKRQKKIHFKTLNLLHNICKSGYYTIVQKLQH